MKRVETKENIEANEENLTPKTSVDYNSEIHKDKTEYKKSIIFYILFH